MRRGEAWWANFRGERRPVVILTRDPAIRLLTSVSVAPTTTTVRNLPTEVRLSRSDGMSRECVVALDGVQTMPKTALRRRITALPESRLKQVCEALRYALGC